MDDPDGPAAKIAGFDDFKLWVDGAPTRYQIETRAFTKSGEVTRLLAAMGIDAASFGHETYDKTGNLINQLSRLSASQKSRLVKVNAITTTEDLSPNWSVRKKYHWTQTFPAHGTVHIRHQYTPVLGNSNTIGDPSMYRGNDAVTEYAQSCPTPALRDTLSKVWNKQSLKPDDVSPLSIYYVSFILTTANTWKTPIEDFTLIVERPHDPKEKTYVSFCWDGPVTQRADHFTAHVTGLVPKKELMIGYVHDNEK